MSNATRREITAAELRKCAESADGQRDVTLTLVYIQPDDLYAMITEAERTELVANGKQLEDVQKTRTPLSNPLQAAQKEISVTATFRQHTKTFSDGVADSIFWTSSAMEKFLLPYYARHLTKPLYDILYEAVTGTRFNPATRQMDKLPEVPLAIFHQPPTIYETIFDSSSNKRLQGLSSEQRKALAPLTAFVFFTNERAVPLLEFIAETNPMAIGLL